MEDLETLEAFTKAKEKHDAALAKSATKVVKRELEKFFAANPDVKVVSWTQYTPYFNDGDPCVFSLGAFIGGTKELTEDQTDSLGRYPPLDDDAAELLGFLTSSGYKFRSAAGDYMKSPYSRADAEVNPDDYGYPFDPEKYEMLNVIEIGVDILGGRLSKHPDLLKAAFGDDAQVIVTPTTIKVRQVDHD